MDPANVLAKFEVRIAQEWVKLSEIIAIGVLGGSCEPNLQERVARSLRGREWYLVFSVLHFRRIRAASLKPIMFQGPCQGFTAAFQSLNRCQA